MDNALNVPPNAPVELSPTPSAPKGVLDNRGLVNAAMLIMLFFVLSRVIGLAREIMISARFGTSAELDAYLAAFRVPDLLFNLVAGGALGSAFIPTFAVFWTRQQYDKAWLLFSRVLNLITFLLIVITLVVALFAPLLVQRLIAPGFTPAQQMITAHLMRAMLISTVIFGISGLVMGALNAVQHFLLPAAAPLFYNLAIILGAWFLTPRFGIDGLVIGVVVGALLHLLVQLPGLWRMGASYTPSLYWHDPGVREVARLMGPRVLGILFVQMQFLVNTILASGLSAGSLVALNNAWLLLMLPLGIFAQSVATAVFPTFAAQVAAQQTDAMRRTLGQTLRTVLFLTIPAATLLYVLRVPLIGALFQRGRFTSESTQLVAYALQFYALGLTAHAVVEIAVRAFYALHDTLTPVIIGITAMSLNILFSFWWIHRLGYGGLALANSTATTLEMIALLWLLHRRTAGIEARALLLSIGRHMVAALLMGGICWVWLAWAMHQHWATLPQVGAILLTLSAAVVGGSVYLVSCALLRSTELQPALALIMRRRR
jgi:putative peptidoglycan lipid II flippase